MLEFLLGISISGLIFGVLYFRKREECAEIKAELEIKNIALQDKDKELENQERDGKRQEEFEELMNIRLEQFSRKVLLENNKKFTENNKNEMDKILNPFKENFGHLEQHIKDCYKSELREKLTLQVEIKKLIELNTKLSQGAENLTKALKGDNKIQGDWGETILERVLENSGLRKGVEYQTQVTDKNFDGNIIKPDVIVYLPDNKQVIIDAKMSLKSYDNFMQADNEDMREVFLKAHIISIKQHIKILSEKNYHTAKNHHSLEFTMMFIPIEPAYFLALQGDEELFWQAWKKKILIVSPTTLHSTLKIIVTLWKQEKQNKNVKEIAKLSSSLYKKFENFIGDMKNISSSLKKAEISYDNAFNKLKAGNGNIMKTLDKMQKLSGDSANNDNFVEEKKENIDYLEKIV